MRVLAGYQPEKVFKYFEEICAIPHGSGNVKEISDYLVTFAKERGLQYRQDEKYNVIIRKGGSKGYEDSVPVILQGHMDMVAVKDPGVDKDMEKDGLDLALEGDMIYARGTSLGGDDGIAVAYMLAVLDGESLAHPPVEAVFTTDEEVGMLGAAYLDCSDLKGRTLLNIDSEDEGVFTVSCAGGATIKCIFPVQREKKKLCRLTFEIDGLKGGHSGADIDKGTLNANLALGRILYGLAKETGLGIIDISGGEKDNAIPVWCRADLAISKEDVRETADRAREIFDTIKEEYKTVEPGIKLSLSVKEPELVELLRPVCAEKVTTALMNMPCGIQRMNPDMKDMVQTSLNLGVVRTEKDAVTMTFCVRSSSETEKRHLIDRILCLCGALGGSMEVAGDYPGWEYQPRSRVRDVMVETFQELYGQTPVVEGIHAGLECGLFSAKLPRLDAISFGPQINDIHTSRERLSMESVKRTWELLLKTLKKLQ